jgi:hypothetical protein
MRSPSAAPLRVLHGADAIAALAHRPSWAELWRRVSDPEPPPTDKETAQEREAAS